MDDSCDPVHLDSCAPGKIKITLKQRFGDGVNKEIFDPGSIDTGAAMFENQTMELDPKFEQDYGWEKDPSHTALKPKPRRHGKLQEI